jgi:predicted dehydrogenase
VKAAIIGAGGIARRHARACREVAGVELVAVCDTRAAAADRLADEFGIPARYPSLDALLAAGPLDIAIVATWGDSHAAITTALARAGGVRAILCEKPLCLTAAEAEGMVQTAAAHGVLLAEAFKFRHHPVHRRAEALVRAGRLGRVVHVRSTFTTATPPAARDPAVNWRFHAGHGGGALYDLGCYCLHQARAILAAEPTSVYATGQWGAASGVDEAVAASLTFPDDRQAQFWISFGAVPSQSVEVYGTDGMLQIDRAWNNEDQPTALVIDDGRGGVEREEFPPVFQFALQLEHLCDCLRTGQPFRISPENSLAQMRALDALYASLRGCNPVAVAR